jgi:hypothetical protein
MNYDCIIPLGSDCAVSFLLKNSNLKKETTLFEWFVTNSLQKISNIIYKIANNIEVELITGNLSLGNISLDDNDIYTGHYTFNEYISIYDRRKKRLIDSIKNKKKILFIRIDFSNYKYTENDINIFINSIKYINQNIDEMKLLLITEDILELKHPFLINKIISPSIRIRDPYFNNEYLKSFINILEEI